MPIGFWAISRQELKEMIEARSGSTPDSYYLNRLCKQTRERLDEMLDAIVEQAITGHKKELR